MWVAAFFLVGWWTADAVFRFVAASPSPNSRWFGASDQALFVALVALFALFVLVVLVTSVSLFVTVAGAARRADEPSRRCLWALLPWMLSGAVASGRQLDLLPGDARQDPPGVHLAVLQVSGIGSKMWKGRVHAVLQDGRWERVEPPRWVRGRGRLPATGNYFARGRLLGHYFAIRQVLSDDAGTSARRRFFDARDEARKALVGRWRRAFGPEIGDFAGWILLGWQPEDANEVRRPFVQTGTAHLLAISGLHVGLIAVIVLGTVRLFVRQRAGALRTTVALLIVFGVLSGGAVSVQRSVLVFALAVLGRGWGRRVRVWNALGWAAVVLPLFDPAMPRGPGYILSLSATAGVLLGADLGDRWRHSDRIPEQLRSRLAATASALGASLGAQCLTWTWSLHFFQLFPWHGLWINPWIVILAAVVVPALVFATVTDALFPGFVGGEPGRSASALLLGLVEQLGGNRDVSLVPLALPWAWALTFASGFALWRASRGAAPGWVRSSAAALLLVGGHAGSAPTTGAEIIVTFLDVGQGDSVLLQLPDANWLYDLGPPPAYRNVERTLREASVERLDRLFLTHGDLDHWGGLTDLLRSSVRVDTLVLPATGPFPDSFWEALAGAEQKPHVTIIERGWERSWPGMRCVCLHPSPGVALGGRNDHSTVLRFSIGEHELGLLLLGGDIEEPGQQMLLTRGDIGPVLVAQAGHHGSKTSLCPGWYEALEPKLVVCSAGRGNGYGLPHPEFLDELEARDIRLFRTDEDGAVSLRWTGKAWEVRRGDGYPWASS